MKNLFLKFPFNLFIIPFFIIIALQFLSSNINLLQFPSRDFRDFYVTGTWVQTGRENPDLKFGQDIVRNPPPSLLLFSFFSLFPILEIQAYWFIASLIFFFTGSYFLFKTFRWFNLKIWLLFISLVLIFFPFRYNLGSGQVNNLLYMLIVLTFYFSQIKKNYLASISLCLAIILKITPLFLLITLLIERRVKIFVLTIINLAAINIVTMLVLGSDIYQKYSTVPGTFLDFGNAVYYNQTLSAFLFRVLNNAPLVRFIDLTFLIIFSLVLMYLKRKPSFKDKLIDRLNLWNISIIYMLIFAPFAWQYHFVIIIFALVSTFYIGYKQRYESGFFFLLFLSFMLLGWNIKNPGAISGFGLAGQIILSHTFFGALLLLYLNIFMNFKKDNLSIWKLRT